MQDSLVSRGVCVVAKHAARLRREKRVPHLLELVDHRIREWHWRPCFAAIGRPIHPLKESANPTRVGIEESNPLHRWSHRAPCRYGKRLPMIASVARLRDPVHSVLRLQARVDEL